MKNTKLLLILISVIIVRFVFEIVVTSGLKIPPKAMTNTRMIGIEQRIRKYVDDNGKLPVSLSHLQKRSGYDNSTKDGWGNDIIYNADANERVRLSSMGKDGTSGGTDENADIRREFTIEMN
jgi:hypothetical protein